METKVLVYDNEVGYYHLLKDVISDGFEFTLYNNSDNNSRYDVVVFFMHDEIEVMDMVKLYRRDIPFVLGADNGHTYIQHRDNAHIINTALSRDEIIETFIQLFKEIDANNVKEEALQ
jgi:hypothetical protein